MRLRRTEPPALWTLLYRYIPVGLSKKIENQSVRSFIKTRAYKSQNPSGKDWHAWSSSLAPYCVVRGSEFDNAPRGAVALPWADWDDPRLSGYFHDAFCTLIVPGYDKRGPQPPKLILGRLLRLRLREIKVFDQRAITARI